ISSINDRRHQSVWRDNSWSAAPSVRFGGKTKMIEHDQQAYSIGGRMWRPRRQRPRR
ncbi:hypothetical protein RDWZM_004466, partial [Blomia tropicalis]